MAERHQLKIADRNDIADDDPFAELTRIMGFDPREPVAQQASPQAPAQDEFDIDLEKELMGEFADFDAPAPMAETASEAEADLPSPEPRQPARQQGEENALALEADMDDAVATALEEDFGLADEAMEAVSETWQAGPEDHGGLPDETAQEDGSLSAQNTWFGPAEDETAEAVAHEGETAASGQGFEAFDDEAFDTAVSADLDDVFPEAGAVAADFAYEEAGPTDVAPAAEEQPAEEGVSYAETLEEGQLEVRDAYRDDDRAADPDDFDSYFDSAMADVDMDFTARDFTARPEEQPSASAMPAVDEPVLDAQDMEDEGFDPSEAFEVSAFAEPVSSVEPPEVSYAEPEAPAATGADTLEDELNALLAKMSARPAITADAAWPMATPTASAAAAPSPTPVETAPGDDDLDAALVADLHAMDLSDAHEPVETVPQDDTPAGMSDWSVPEPAAADSPALQAGGMAQQGAPEIETVEVPERVAALADDLDIPDVPFEEAGSDKLDGDLENEFAELLGQMNASPAQLHAAYDDDAYAGGFRDDPVQTDAAFARSSPSAYDAAGTDAGALPLAGAAPFTADELAYDPEDTPALDPALTEETRRPRRGLMIAGIVGAVAVAGGLGALAMSFGGSGADEAPALVKADTTPIKVKPENPGGMVIPNQDNKVYEAVANGIKPAAPEQQKLVTSNEELADVDAVTPRVVGLDKTAEPAGKSEARIEQTAQADEATVPQPPLVTPHKVRTMVVKPDGTLVPREEAAPQVAAAEPADPAPQHVVADDRTGAVPAVEDENAVAGEETREAAADVAATPQTAPIAPQRPSDQPVDVVGEVKPDRVASVAPTGATVPAGAWSMQIASQPTAESAQSTYQTLSRRYASVLGGHEVNIVKAEIAGKGTFYRVRVPTGSRNDAITLCESYKAAGGNCFVSK